MSKVVSPFVFLPETPREQFVCRFSQEFTLVCKSTLSVALSLCVCYTSKMHSLKKAFCYVCDWFLAIK